MPQHRKHVPTREFIRLYRSDLTNAEIAAHFDMSPCMVNKITAKLRAEGYDLPYRYHYNRVRIPKSEFKKLWLKYINFELEQRQLVTELDMSFSYVKEHAKSLGLPVIRKGVSLTSGVPSDNAKVLGEDCAASKLTARDVRRMRKMYEKEDVSVETIAGRFNMSRQQAHNIISRRAWKHV